MAILTYDKSAKDVDPQVVKGPLRALVIPKFIDEQVTLCMDVDPYGKGKDVTISTTVSEFAQAISGSYDFDNILANVIKLQQSDSAVLRSFIPLKVMKDSRENAVALALTFRKVLDQIEKEIPQFDAWIAQAEKGCGASRLPKRQNC